MATYMTKRVVDVDVKNVQKVYGKKGELPNFLTY